MIEHDGAWLPSVWLGLPALIFGVLVCMGLIALAVRYADDRVDAIALSVLPVLGALATRPSRTVAPMADRTHVGSAITPSGRLVWHLMERGRVGGSDG